MGVLSPVMLTAGAGFLPAGSADPSLGPSLGTNTTLLGLLNQYNSLGIISQVNNILSSASGFFSTSALQALQQMGSSTLPALSNSIPAALVSDLNVMAPGGVFSGGLSGLVASSAANIMGGGDLTRFCQIFSAANGYRAQANQYINSNSNVAALQTTFGDLTGGMDNTTTGGINQVTEAFGSFGQDLRQLGNLINLKNLDNLGSPAALVKQIISVGGLIPSVRNLLVGAGLSSAQIGDLVTGSLSGLSDSVDKFLYEGMTRVTGNDLDQVKTVLGVTVNGIDNMAQLLDPVKIFPSSFFTLTMPTPNGLRGIYVDTQGSVNSNLAQFLTTTPDTLGSVNPDLITRSRQGSSVVGGSFVPDSTVRTVQ